MTVFFTLLPASYVHLAKGYTQVRHLLVVRARTKRWSLGWILGLICGLRKDPAQRRKGKKTTMFFFWSTSTPSLRQCWGFLRGDLSRTSTLRGKWSSKIRPWLMRVVFICIAHMENGRFRLYTLVTRNKWFISSSVCKFYLYFVEEFRVDYLTLPFWK